MLDRNPGKSLSELKSALPTPALADHVAALRRRVEVRRGRRVVRITRRSAANGGDPGPKIVEAITVNGVRRPRGRLLGPGPRLIQQAGTRGGGREPASEDDMRALFREIEPAGEAARGRRVQSGDLTAQSSATQNRQARCRKSAKRICFFARAP